MKFNNIPNKSSNKSKTQTVSKIHVEPKPFSIPQMPMKKKNKLKVKIYLYSVLSLFLILISLILYFIIQEYLATHTFKWQSPILINFQVKSQTPLVIKRKKEIVISPVGKGGLNFIKEAQAQSIPSWKVMPENVDKKKWEYAVQQPLGHFLVYIWKQESDYGRNTVQGSLDQHCRTIGKYNEFGLGGMKNLTCYDTFEENVQAVIKTLNGYGEMSDRMKLCYYNLGIREDSCNYLAVWSEE